MQLLNVKYIIIFVQKNTRKSIKKKFTSIVINHNYIYSLVSNKSHNLEDYYNVKYKSQTNNYTIIKESI